MLCALFSGSMMRADSESTSIPLRRLVILEGIMGSGKSTTARWLAARLAERGFEARLQVERQYPHPLRGTDAAGDWFKPWLDMSARDIATRRLTLWRKFVQDAIAQPAIHVIDGQLFHGDLTNMLLMKMPELEMADNVRELEAIVQPLNPLVVYFHQTDVDRAIRLTAAERGEELGVRYQVDWKLAFPYAVELGLEGLEGLSALYVRYRALTDRLFEELRSDKISIENTPRDWPRYYSLIEEALGF
jgi:hypothetical protein